MSISPDILLQSYQTICEDLLSQRTPALTWEGELSTSALSTATAVMALELVRRAGATYLSKVRCEELIQGGLNWLAETQNEDGGWGDTVLSFSNISTTMLAHAVFHATNTVTNYSKPVEAAKHYIDRVGGVDAVVRRYGKDKTFSIPILTHCALAGLVPWSQVKSLPFELAALPHSFYATVKLPVVSYALPALIAIGQVKYHHRKPWNPISRWIRGLNINRTLRKLEAIQPENGGFLEATPLTSFVTMSLVGKGLVEHPVSRRGVQFIENSVLADGSWPIDTNLATWVTTLSVNALKEEIPESEREPLRTFLLNQQYQNVHPYTHAAPGGWAWTDLPGGVPDADDTPGALLALLHLGLGETAPDRFRQQVQQGVEWLLNLQNRDGGWPTFCRGWGTLPFDRSSPDISAHVLRALHAWLLQSDHLSSPALRQRAEKGIQLGFRFLRKAQLPDGSWLPLWFGNQHRADEGNPVYGTVKVLMAFRDVGEFACQSAQQGVKWLLTHQNSDGGWGGDPESHSSVEETSLAVEILLTAEPNREETLRGLHWLIECVQREGYRNCSPIGFYFAKLWYFEKLYPRIFLASALRTAVASLPQSQSSRQPPRKEHLRT